MGWSLENNSWPLLATFSPILSIVVAFTSLLKAIVHSWLSESFLVFSLVRPPSRTRDRPLPQRPIQSPTLHSFPGALGLFFLFFRPLFGHPPLPTQALRLVDGAPTLTPMIFLFFDPPPQVPLSLFDVEYIFSSSTRRLLAVPFFARVVFRRVSICILHSLLFQGLPLQTPLTRF